jgi:NADH-quinone oxidoreductase subunit N
LVGCIGALTQKRLKRIFIYSSINQVGFSLLGLVTGNLQGFTSSFFFIFIYILSSIGLFSILLNTESYIKGQNLVLLSDLTNFGLFNKRYSFIICIILFSMAGIPPLAGFFSKYYIFKSLVDSSMYMLAIYSILISIVNSFVYIKILKIMFFDKNVNRNENDYFVYCIYKNLYTNIKKKNNVKNLNLCVFYENLITSLLYIISLLLIYIPCDIVVVLNYIKFFTMNCYLILSI